MPSAVLRLAIIDADARGHGALARWLDDVHLPAVAEVPGWRGGLRYGTPDDDPFALVLYDGDERDAGGVPTPLTGPHGRWVRAYAADTFVLTSASGSFRDPPEVLNAIAVDVAPDAAAAFDRWYDEVHVPEILACPGWRAARRFRSVRTPGRFLALYDLDDEVRPFATPEYEQAVGWDAFADAITGHHGFRTYRLRHDGRPRR